MKTIIDILEAELLGKILRVTTSTPIKKTYQEEVKKSASVTDKQFESGEKKYRMTATRTRVVGKKEETKESEIVSVELTGVYSGEVDIKITTKDGWSETYPDYFGIAYFEKPL